MGRNERVKVLNAEEVKTGKVRYMNAAGLERKFDAQGYVKKVQRLEEKYGNG